MQDYVLKSFKVSDFKDNYGNTWCDVSFEGVSEPVKWVVKEPDNIVVGQSYYGEMKDMTSKTGKGYVRFYKRERPDGESAPTNSSERVETVDKQDSIHRSVALNDAALVFQGSGEPSSAILSLADDFYTWLKNEPETNWADEAERNIDD